jgi:hypothetical protein
MDCWTYDETLDGDVITYEGNLGALGYQNWRCWVRAEAEEVADDDDSYEYVDQTINIGEYQTGQCVERCDTDANGSYWMRSYVSYETYDAECTCTTGYHFDAAGICVESGCDDGEYWYGDHTGACECPDAETWDGVTDTCDDRCDEADGEYWIAAFETTAGSCACYNGGDEGKYLEEWDSSTDVCEDKCDFYDGEYWDTTDA